MFRASDIPNLLFYAVDTLYGVDEFGDVYRVKASIQVAEKVFNSYSIYEIEDGFELVQFEDVSADIRALICVGLRDRIAFNTKALRMDIQCLRIEKKFGKPTDGDFVWLEKKLTEIENDPKREDDKYYVDCTRQLIAWISSLETALKEFSRKK